MRSLLVVLVAVALLAGALVAVDIGVTGSAEERVAERVSDRLGAPVEVDIGGWPVTLRTLVTGQVPQVHVHAVDVPAGDGTIDRLDLRLVDVEFGLEDVRGRGDTLPPAEEALFEAEIREESLVALLQLPEGIVTVALEDGVLRFDLAGLEGVDAHIGASDGVVIIEPDTPAAAIVGLARIPIDLSGQPGRPYVEEAEVTGDSIVLRGRLEEMTVGIR